MQEIKCPNCGKVFQVDAAGYAQILQQVRDKEFQRELERRAQEIEQQKKNDLIIAQMEQDKSHREELSGKNRELKLPTAKRRISWRSIKPSWPRSRRTALRSSKSRPN